MRGKAAEFERLQNLLADNHFIGAISAAGPASASAEWATDATIWGNTFTLPSTNDNCIWGIEVGWTGAAVEHNTMAYVGVAMAIGGMPGTEIENNVLTLPSLLTAADQALYEAKNSNRNCTKVYTPTKAA